MRALDSTTAIYLWRGAFDMRCGFDRLASFASEHYASSPLTSGAVYVFFSRCRRRVKLLYWDRDGFAIWHKRLEAGSYRIERSEEHAVVSVIDLQEILAGTELSRIILRKNAENGSFATL